MGTEAAGEHGSCEVLLVRGNERRRCALSWEHAAHRYTMEIVTPEGRCAGAGPDLFAALSEARHRIALNGWLIAVQGSRLDTYRSQGCDLEHVCVLHPGEPADGTEVVGVLDPAEPAQAASTSDQEAFYAQWQASVR